MERGLQIGLLRSLSSTASSPLIWRNLLMKIATIENNHLIGLNNQEALLLLRLLHSSRLHGPTRLERQLGGDADHFVEELSVALLQACTREARPREIPQRIESA